nr:HDOD domain-containing protein [Pseudoalteromonas denitrificans]
MDSVSDLVSQGYIIALDDFVYSDEAKPLLDLVHIVKLDIRALTDEQLQQHITLLRKYTIKLLAEKVETWAEFRYCKALGFDFFQGYFFASPELLNGKKAPHNRLSTLRLMVKVNEPLVNFSELETLFTQDPFIYYKLLRYINSAYTGIRKSFDDIRSILVFLGLDQLRTLVSIMALSTMTEKPPLLFVTMLQRAKLCELIAAKLKLSKKLQNEFFTVGLFSLLEAFLDIPAEKLLSQVPLSDAIKNAILKKEGLGGKILQCAINIERQQCFKCTSCIASEPVIKNCYYTAINWSDDITKTTI